jgi:hypothetical protein
MDDHDCPVHLFEYRVEVSGNFVTTRLNETSSRGSERSSHRCAFRD